MSAAIFLRKPDEDLIRIELAQHREAPFSYREVGLSRQGQAPAGYATLRHQIRLGQGEAAFAKAKQAIRDWKMFNFPWLQLCWSDAPIETGAVVGVLVRAFGLWFLNFCRIAYVLDGGENEKEFGFAYGTLSPHAESGEERFRVARNPEDDSVYYEIFSFSRPSSPLYRLGSPLLKRLQKRFCRCSAEAMQKEVY